MLLSDILETLCADQLGDINTLMRAARGLDICVRTTGEIQRTELVIINTQTDKQIFIKELKPFDYKGDLNGS
jgi:hypothetical protein